MTLTLLLLAASAHPAMSEARCDARAAGMLVGRKASAALEARARKLSGARIVRTLRPGDVVTMEFRPDRLNIHLGGNGRVRRLQCS